MIDFKEMASAQQYDPELLKFQTSPSSLTVEALPLPTVDTTILCDTSTGVPRPLVPTQFRRKKRILSTRSGILASEPHNGSSLPNMYGLVLMLTSGGGYNLVYSVSDPKFVDTPLPHWLHLQLLMPDLTAYTLTM